MTLVISSSFIFRVSYHIIRFEIWSLSLKNWVPWVVSTTFLKMIPSSAMLMSLYGVVAQKKWNYTRENLSGNT